MAVLLLVISAGFGTDIRFTGFADTYLASSFDGGDWNSMRSRLRMNCSSGSGSSWLFASVNAEENHITQEKTQVELREAWFEYAGSVWDMRAGRQIIKWGNTDGIPITDVICPGDYTEFITRDFDDIRMPVDVLQFRLLPLWGSVEALWLPVFEPGIYPSSDSPWATEGSIPEGDVTDAPVMPEKTLENSEYAVRISLFTSGFDAAASCFRTWDDFPVMHRYTEGGTVHWEPRYHRTTFCGAEFSVPVGETVIRGEAGLITGRYFQDTQSEDLTVERDQIKALLGVDWYPGCNWTASVQLADSWLPDHTETINEEEHTVLGTLMVSRQFARQTLEVKNMVYIGITEEDLYNQLSVLYHVTDALEASIGADIFAGPDDTDFGRYEHNTQAFMKVRYSF